VTSHDHPLDVDPDGVGCFTCGENEAGDVQPTDACPVSRRSCGHHCNHYLYSDCCHWCGGEFIEGEDGSVAWVSSHGPAVVVS
jgi:hypothetical protein